MEGSPRCCLMTDSVPVNSSSVLCEIIKSVRHYFPAHASSPANFEQDFGVRIRRELEQSYVAINNLRVNVALIIMQHELPLYDYIKEMFVEDVILKDFKDSYQPFTIPMKRHPFQLAYYEADLDEILEKVSLLRKSLNLASQWYAEKEDGSFDCPTFLLDRHHTAVSKMVELQLEVGQHRRNLEAMERAGALFVDFLRELHQYNEVQEKWIRAFDGMDSEYKRQKAELRKIEVALSRRQQEADMIWQTVGIPELYF